MGATEDCETALVAHWSQLGRLPGGTLHDDDDLVWFETPVRHLPYNGVVRTRLGDDADRAIAGVVDRCRSRGAELWWVDHPSATPADLGERLEAAGLRPVERMNFMALDLRGWERPPAADGVAVEVAQGAEAVDAYTDLTLGYWEVGDDEVDAVRRLLSAVGPDRNPGRRFLARIDGRPVGKAYLSLAGPPGVAAIYGMSVRPEARGRGVAAALSAALMASAKGAGADRAVLHATDVAVGVYRRTGFVPCGGATVYATARLWS